MKQIQITTNATKFRGVTVFKGDVVPAAGDAELTADEIGVLVPRLADEVSDAKAPKKKVAKEAKDRPEQRKAPTEATKGGLSKKESSKDKS